jgi:macrolide-specific efflux system membrane fusion protein
MTQMTAQVFFVRGAAHDAVLVPVAALQFTGRGGARAGAAPDAAAANEQGARAGRNGAGRGGRGGRGGGARGGAAFDPEAGLRPRPATVTVVRDDGMHEVRDVTVGVTDRVNAAILSGLNEGEKVVAGMQVAGGDGGTQRQQRPNGFGAPGGVPGGLPGRIGGFR